MKKYRPILQIQRYALYYQNKQVLVSTPFGQSVVVSLPYSITKEVDSYYQIRAEVFRQGWNESFAN